MMPETLAMIKTIVMCIQTIVLAAACFLVIKFFRDGRIQAERETKLKREKLEKLLRAMEEERDFVLDDLSRQAGEIVKGRLR